EVVGKAKEVVGKGARSAATAPKETGLAAPRALAADLVTVDRHRQEVVLSVVRLGNRTGCLIATEIVGVVVVAEVEVLAKARRVPLRHPSEVDRQILIEELVMGAVAQAEVVVYSGAVDPVVHHRPPTAATGQADEALCRGGGRLVRANRRQTVAKVTEAGEAMAREREGSSEDPRV
ncbi:unnamed protein product, partial [Polarella glacialis]